MDEIINNLKDNLQEAYKDTIILTLQSLEEQLNKTVEMELSMVMELQYLWQGVC